MKRVRPSEVVEAAVVLVALALAVAAGVGGFFLGRATKSSTPAAGAAPTPAGHAERRLDALARDGRAPSGTFEGKGACFVEMGDGIAAYATGDFYAEDEPQVRLRRPGRHWHLAKIAFEKYWFLRWL